MSSLIKIKQIAGPSNGVMGGVVVFDGSTLKWSTDLSSALVLPAGNTSQRPLTAAPGSIRFNTDTNTVELLTGSTWGSLNSTTSKIVNADSSTFVDTDNVASPDIVIAGSHNKTVLEIEGSTNSATAGERLNISHIDSEVQLSAKNTAGTGDVDVRVLPQAQGHVYFGTLGDGVVESELGFSLTVKGGNSSSTDSAGDLTLTGGLGTSNNANGGSVIIKAGTANGTGTIGAVKVTDTNDVTIMDFVSAGAGASNWLTVTSGIADPDLSKNGVKISANVLSSAAAVDIFLDPKGAALVRVSDYSAYEAALAASGTNDALVTKGYVDALTGNTGGEDPTATLPGVGLSESGQTFNVNVSALTVGVDGSNNLIVKSSATTGQLLMSTGTAGDQAVWGILDLSTPSNFTGALSVANGGTGVTTYAVGDILVGANSALSTLAKGAQYTVLTATDVSVDYEFIGALRDTNGTLVVNSITTASAVNNLTVTNAVDGGPVVIGTAGTSADVPMVLAPQGNALVAMKPGYTALIGSDRETIATIGFVSDSIAGSNEPYARVVAISSGYSSVMNIGTLTPSISPRNVYPYRAVINVSSVITGGGVTQAKIMSGADTVMAFVENDILTLGTYIADLPELFTSNNTQLTIQFFGADGTTQATPTGGSITASVYYRIR